MKKFIALFIVVFSAMLSFLACDKEQVIVQRHDDSINVEVSISAPVTKATDIGDAISGKTHTSDEAKVNSLQVVIFDGTAIDGYSVVEDGLSVSVATHSGSRDIYAFVNAPDLSGCANKNEVLSTVASLGASVGNFVMVGNTTGVLSDGAQLTIYVNRLAARVIIRKIKNALANPALASSFKVKEIYLTNIAGSIALSGVENTVPSDAWFNRRGYESRNNLGAVSYDLVNKNVSYDSVLDEAHYFYTMPNSHAAASGAVSGYWWTPRACKLVVRCTIGGVDYDYPIDFGNALLSNKSYEIVQLNITRLGNVDDGNNPSSTNSDDTDEETQVEGVEQGVVIEVDDWNVKLVSNSGHDDGEWTI